MSEYLCKVINVSVCTKYMLVWACVCVCVCGHVCGRRSSGGKCTVTVVVCPTGGLKDILVGHESYWLGKWSTGGVHGLLVHCVTYWQMHGFLAMHGAWPTAKVNGLLV